LLHARFVRQIALSVKLEYTQGAEWFNVGRYGGRDLAGSPVVALDLRRAAMNGLVAGPLATLWDGRDSFGTGGGWRAWVGLQAGNAGNAGNNPVLEANPLKIMPGGPYTTTYNNK